MVVTSNQKRSTVVVLYGPHSAGKLTVATELEKLTGFKVFHNHLTVEPVRALFDLGTPQFARVVWHIRTFLFEEAAQAGVSLIYTMNTARGIDPPETNEQSVGRIENAVHKHHGRVVYVHLEPARDVLEARIQDPDRKMRGKLVDIERARETLEGWTSESLHWSDLRIDNTHVTPDEAARIIRDHYRL